MLGIGEEVEIKGPIGKMVYQEKSRLTLNSAERKVRKLNMICGGTGITPIYQVLRAIMEDPNDETQCTVLYGNRREEDILCRREIEELEALGRGRCKVIHTLTQGSEEWTGLRGRINGERMEEYLHLKDAVERDDELVLLCGPGPMEQDVKAVLKSIGWREENVCVF